MADDAVLPLDNDTPLDVAPTAESNRGPAAGERESFNCARRALEELVLVPLLTAVDRSSERDLENGALVVVVVAVVLALELAVLLLLLAVFGA